MSNVTLWIIIGVTFASFAGVFLLIIYLSNKKASRDRQIKSITSNATALDNNISDARRQAMKKAEVARKLKEAKQEQEAKRKKKKGTLRSQLNQAGFHTPIGRYWMYCFISACAVFLLSKFFGLSMPATLLMTIVGFFGLPRVFLKFRANRRQKKFLEEFADALDGMVRLLRAGMPVAEAVKMVGREFQGPVGEEMAEMYENQKVGLSLAEAAERAVQRMPITEMQMFATGVAIQSETGASLSEVLTNLAKLIRSRFRLKRKVKALSSEAKSSAMIIGSLPLIVGGGMKLVNPEYMDPMFEETIGIVLLWGCGIWMGIGVLVMRQMINFKV